MNDFNLDPNFRHSLTGEQTATLERLERLAELDPLVTARLARALDRLQRAMPYQQFSPRPSTPASEPALPELSPAELAAREKFITRELTTLLAVAGQLARRFEDNRHQAQPDRRFKESLRAQFK